MGFALYSLKLAWRLLLPRRSVYKCITLACVVGVALGCMLQIVVRGVMAGMVREIDVGMQACTPHLLVDSECLRPESAESLPGVEACRYVYMGRGIANGSPCSYATWGRLLGPAYASYGEEDVLVSRTFAEKSGLGAGNSLVLSVPGSSPIIRKVIGEYHVPGRMLTPDVIAMAPLPGFRFLGLRLEKAGNAAAVWNALKKRDEACRLLNPASDAEAWVRLIDKVKRAMGAILYASTLISAFSAGGLMLAICLLRRRALGVALAYGAAPWQCAGIFLWQGALIGIAGAAAGAGLAALLLHYRLEVQRVLKAAGVDAFPVNVLDMQLPAYAPPSLYAEQAGAAFLIVMLAAAPAAWRALRRGSLR